MRPLKPERFPTPLKLCAWMFPVMLWFFAVFFMLGDLGWWNDDFFFNMRDPATGEYSSVVLTRRDPYLEPTGHLNPWRPLHFILTPALVTWCWDTPWIAHLVGALIHGINCILLFKLIRTLGASVHAAAASALLFMVHPLHYEVPLWPAAFATGLSNGLFILNAFLTARAARTMRATHFWTIPLLTAFAVCLNEQASVCIGALPLLYLAVCPSDEPWPKRIIRACVPVALGCIVIAIYVANVRINGQEGIGTSAETYVHAKDLPARVIEVLTSMAHYFSLDGFARGATLQGVVEFFEYTGRTVVIVGATGCAGLAASWLWLNSPIAGRVSPSATTPRGGRGWLVLAFALAWMIIATLPQSAIVGYNANPRTFYLVCAAFFVAFSVAGDTLAMLVARVPGLAGPYRVVSALGLLVMLLWGATMYVGVQGRQKRVYHEGLAQAEQLKATIPNPAPGTYFLPLAHYSKPVNTGIAYFDHVWLDVWTNNWTTPTFLKLVYRRNDVYQGFYNHLWDGTQEREPIGGIDFDMVLFSWRGDTPYGVGDTIAARIPLEKVVPFVVDPDKNIRIVTDWFVKPQDGGLPFMVNPGQTNDLAARHQIPRFQFEWPEPVQWPYPRPSPQAAPQPAPLSERVP